MRAGSDSLFGVADRCRSRYQFRRWNRWSGVRCCAGGTGRLPLRTTVHGAESRIDPCGGWVGPVYRELVCWRGGMGGIGSALPPVAHTGERWAVSWDGTLAMGSIARRSSTAGLDGRGERWRRACSSQTISVSSVSSRSASSAGLSGRRRWKRGKRRATPDLWRELRWAASNSTLDDVGALDLPDGTEAAGGVVTDPAVEGDEFGVGEAGIGFTDGGRGRRLRSRGRR